MARYTINRNYEDQLAEKVRARKAIAESLKVFILAVVLKERK